MPGSTHTQKRQLAPAFAANQGSTALHGVASLPHLLDPANHLNSQDFLSRISLNDYVQRLICLKPPSKRGGWVSTSLLTSSPVTTQVRETLRLDLRRRVRLERLAMKRCKSAPRRLSDSPVCRKRTRKALIALNVVDFVTYDCRKLALASLGTKK